MARHITHKSTDAGKRETLARRNARAVKSAQFGTVKRAGRN